VNCVCSNLLGNEHILIAAHLAIYTT